MSESPAPVPPDEQARRTMLLNIERTWLAWWRTGLVSAAAAIALGRVAPEVLNGRDFPYIVIGVGYAALSVAMLVLGGIRQRRLARAVQEGRFADLSAAWVAWLTAAGAVLAVITMVVVAVAP